MYKDRLDLYSQIEDIRKRPLIAYVTSYRQNSGAGIISADVIPEFCNQIKLIPDKYKKIDFLIVSNGGDPITVWRIMSLLRERFEHIGVLIPYQAFSGATLLALGADEIIMHPFSNLGPVDPQMQSHSPNGTVHFSADDITHYMEFVKNEVGITDQEQKERAFELLCDKVTPLDIGVARKSTILSMSLGEKLLGTHMQDLNTIKSIASTLNKSFYHHGYPIGKKEAIALGLPVAKANKDIENIMWNIWSDFEKEMKCNDPFDPLSTAMEQDAFAEKCGIVNKHDFSKETYATVIANIPVGVTLVYYELLHAALESNNARSGYYTTSQLSISKEPNLNLHYGITQICGKWLRR